MVVLTDKYAEKADTYKGGVGYETQLLNNITQENLDKIIPIMRFKGDKTKAIPLYLKGVTYIDFSDDSNFGDSFKQLIHKIFKVDNIEIEPLGDIPELKPKKITIDTIKKKSSLPKEIIPSFKEITDIDKNKFIRKSYSEIIKYLIEICKKTKLNSPNFDFDNDVITKKKTILRFYINGMQKTTVKIWLSNIFFRTESINILYGDFMIDDDSRTNEIIRCEVNENKELELKMTINMINSKEAKDSRSVAIEIWKNILIHLQ